MPAKKAAAKNMKAAPKAKVAASTTKAAKKKSAASNAPKASAKGATAMKKAAAGTSTVFTLRLETHWCNNWGSSGINHERCDKIFQSKNDAAAHAAKLIDNFEVFEDEGYGQIPTDRRKNPPDNGELLETLDEEGERCVVYIKKHNSTEEAKRENDIPMEVNEEDEEQMENESSEEAEAEDEEDEVASSDIPEADRFCVTLRGQNGYSLTVCESTDIDAVMAKLAELKYVRMDTKTRKLCELSFEFEYDDDTPKLDFFGNAQVAIPGGGSGGQQHATLNTFLADVEALAFRCCPFKRFAGPVMLPKCVDLAFDHSGNCFGGGPEFRAPKLTTIDFQFCTYNADIDKCLSDSLNASPYLERFTSYKLWGPDKLGPLYLPSVKELNFYRSDCLSSLKIYAPRLEELGLRAAYDVRNVQLMARGSKDHKDFKTETGEKLNLTNAAEFSKFVLDVINGGPSKEKCEEWANWPRLKKVVWQCTDDGFPIGDYMSEDSESDYEESDNIESGGSPEPLPVHLVTVAGISEKERKNRARWIREVGNGGDGCSLM